MMPLKTVFSWKNFFLKWPSILKSMESDLFTTRVLLYNQSIIPSTDVIQLTLTLKMTAQVVETLVNVNNDSSIKVKFYKNKALFFSSPRLALRARVAFRAKYRVRPAWLIKRLSCRLQSLGIPTVPYSELTSEWCHGRCIIIASWQCWVSK